MNRLTTLIAAGTIAGAAATFTLPAQAQEYYVVHPNGQVTREYTGHNRLYGRSYISFTFGAPGFWYWDSHRHYYRYRRAHEQREHWRRDHWRHSYAERDDRRSHRGFDND